MVQTGQLVRLLTSSIPSLPQGKNSQICSHEIYYQAQLSTLVQVID